MKRLFLSIVAGAAALALGGCETYDEYGYGGYGDRRYGDYRYDGRDFARHFGSGPFRGPGAAVLDPWLAETEEGNRIVRMGFHGARRGILSRELAHRANIWFRRHADTDRDLCLTDIEIRIALANASRPNFARRY